MPCSAALASCAFRGSYTSSYRWYSPCPHPLAISRGYRQYRRRRAGTQTKNRAWWPSMLGSHRRELVRRERRARSLVLADGDAALVAQRRVGAADGVDVVVADVGQVAESVGAGAGADAGGEGEQERRDSRACRQRVSGQPARGRKRVGDGGCAQDISRARARMIQPNEKASRTRAAESGFWNVWYWPPSPVSSSIAQLL